MSASPTTRPEPLDLWDEDRYVLAWGDGGPVPPKEELNSPVNLSISPMTSSDGSVCIDGLEESIDSPETSLNIRHVQDTQLSMSSNQKNMDDTKDIVKKKFAPPFDPGKHRDKQLLSHQGDDCNASTDRDEGESMDREEGDLQANGNHDHMQSDEYAVDSEEEDEDDMLSANTFMEGETDESAAAEDGADGDSEENTELPTLRLQENAWPEEEESGKC
jgi:hypothetical protein